MQTLASRAARARIRPRFARTRLDTDDGDFIDVDVWERPRTTHGACLLLHGLEGCAHSGYMVSTCAALTARGVQAIALNFRSCSGEANRTAGSYHSGRTDDIDRALRWIAGRFSGLPIAAAGFSLGGNALLNLLGRRPGSPSSDVAAAVAVSVPYELAACSAALERGVGRLYARFFLRTLRRKAEDKARRFPDLVPIAAASARTVREFDDLVTAPLHGFRNADDYYDRCSGARHIGSVTVPMLLIQSADDPLVPGSSLPLDVIQGQDNLKLDLTEHGGHVGFMDRRFGTGPDGWLEARIAEFVSARLREVDPGSRTGVEPKV